jgi:hypothetical protein
MWEEGVGGLQYCVHIYVNGKIRPFVTIPGMGGEGIKENNGRDEFNYDTL